MIINEQLSVDETFDPGYVNIYHNGKLLFKNRPNLTTLYGKEFVLQSITKIIPTNTVIGDVRNYKLDSFSLGSGSSIINSTGNISILTPSLFDNVNYTPIILDTGSNYTTDGTIKKIISGTTNIGSITTSTNSIYNDIYKVKINHYNTTIKYSCRLDVTEPVDLNTGDSFNINEAFLYATNPNDINNFIPFSHVTFENQNVKKGDNFDIIWYLIL